MNMYKIRVTGDVLETSAATRRVAVNGQVLTFGREPVYVRADELPPELATDPCLRIEAVPAETTEPTGGEVIDLKSERLQEEAVAPDPLDPGEETDLKSERLQEEAVAPDPLNPGEETDLKSERLQDDLTTPSAAPSPAARKRR